MQAFVTRLSETIFRIISVRIERDGTHYFADIDIHDIDEADEIERLASKTPVCEVLIEENSISILDNSRWVELN